MKEWWKQSSSPLADASPLKRAVAYYRHSAQDRQENSIPIQSDQVREFARKHGLEIIQEFKDHGKSGLSTESRDAFIDMIDNWVKKRDDFRFVLVLDVSRWGRFQDIDLSATYSSECTKNGKLVVYTSIGFPKENDLAYSVIIGLERYRAAQYSKELSEKVFKGCAKIAQQGFRAGGNPPYGMQRVLLNEARKPIQILAPGERKSIQNQRVTLASGDEKQTVVVKRIFDAFISGKLENDIANSLNKDGLVSPGNKAWDAEKVRHILHNETYTGTLVYNKTTQRLQSNTKVNPLEEWIRTPKAFKGIISQDQFEKAQEIFRDRARFVSPENMLDRLKRIYGEFGFFSASLLDADSGGPPASRYVRQFGSIDKAFLTVFDEVLQGIRNEIKGQFVNAGLSVEEYQGFLIIERSLTILIQPSVPIPHGYRVYWSFTPARRVEIDITLGVPLSNSGKYKILGYLAFPRMLVSSAQIQLSNNNDYCIELFGHNGLELIKDIIK